MYQILLPVFEYGVKILGGKKNSTEHVCSSKPPSVLCTEAACLCDIVENPKHLGHCQVGIRFVTLTLICNCPRLWNKINVLIFVGVYCYPQKSGHHCFAGSGRWLQQFEAVCSVLPSCTQILLAVWIRYLDSMVPYLVLYWYC